MRPLIILAALCAASPAWAQNKPHPGFYCSIDNCETALPDTMMCQSKENQLCWGKTPPEPDTSWHLLTQSFGGTVSLIKGLTKEECEAAQYKLYTHPSTWWQEHMASPVYQLPGDIRTAECFQ